MSRVLESVNPRLVHEQEVRDVSILKDTVDLLLLVEHDDVLACDDGDPVVLDYLTEESLCASAGAAYTLALVVDLLLIDSERFVLLVDVSRVLAKAKDESL